MLERERHRDRGRFRRLSPPALPLSLSLAPLRFARDRADFGDPSPDALAATGSVTGADSPSRASCCCSAFTFSWTICWVEVVLSTTMPAPAPASLAPVLSRRSFGRFFGEGSLIGRFFFGGFFGAVFGAGFSSVFSCGSFVRFRTALAGRWSSAPVRWRLLPGGSWPRVTFTAVTRRAPGAKTIRPSSTSPVSCQPLGLLPAAHGGGGRFAEVIRRR